MFPEVSTIPLTQANCISEDIIGQSVMHHGDRCLSPEKTVAAVSTVSAVSAVSTGKKVSFSPSSSVLAVHLS